MTDSNNPADKDDLDRWLAALREGQERDGSITDDELRRDVESARAVTAAFRAQSEIGKVDDAATEMAWRRLQARLKAEGTFESKDDRRGVLGFFFPTRSGGSGVLAGSGVRLGLALAAAGAVYLAVRGPEPVSGPDAWPVIRGEPPGLRGEGEQPKVVAVAEPEAAARQVASAIHAAGAKPIVYVWERGWTVLATLDADQSASVAAALSSLALPWQPNPGRSAVTLARLEGK